jgi:malonyl-CoA decarboxylase
MRPLMLDHLLTSIADAGRDLLRARSNHRRRSLESLCRDLLSTKGEASGAALARELVEAYREMSDAERLEFYALLAREFGPDTDRIQAAVEEYRAAPGFDALLELRKAAEPPRQELFRRMNLAPGGTRAILSLRTQLLRVLGAHPELREVDADLHHLIASWFNPGFLTLTRIDWDSPASLLEKLVKYERVHRMRSLEDIRRRLAADRRCFAFFHPALPDEPLIFVQVALVQGMADKVQPLIDPEAPIGRQPEADTAIFYSISNCQDGLRGVTLGNFLIKLVVANLAVELPDIRTYATLSPIPGFAAWLSELRTALPASPLVEGDQATLELLDHPGWEQSQEAVAALRPVLSRLCAHYLVRAKDRGNARPRDPVARFHLGNGARLERINWLGDISEKGLAQSHGLLVNYRYDPARIERNHEAYANHGEIVYSPAVRSLLPRATEAAQV